MYPLLFGSFSTYAVFNLILGVVAGVAFVRLLMREGLSLRFILLSQAVLVVGALAGGKLMSWGARGWPVDVHLASELTGGLRFSGVIIGLVIFLPLAYRWFLSTVSVGRVLDVLAIVLVCAVCVSRIACLLTGCCTGAEGEGFLHLSYAPGSSIWYKHLHSGVMASSHEWSKPVLALPILFGLASAAAAAVLFWLNPRRSYDGQVFLVFLLIHEWPKALLELLRDPIIPSQLVATVIAGTVGAIALVYYRRNPPVTPISVRKPVVASP